MEQRHKKLLSVQSIHGIEQSLAPSIFNQSLPNSQCGLQDKWRTKCTIYSQNGFIQCACAATNFHSNEIFCFVNDSGHISSPNLAR